MSKQKFTKIKVGTNSKGKTFSIQHEINYFGEDKGYGVWELCENYAHGKIHKCWRYIKCEMSLDDAEKLFAKKTK